MSIINNDPLTVDELSSFVGKPLWIDFSGSSIKRNAGWYILRSAQEGEAYLVGEVSIYKSFEYYRTKWIAYRHEP